MKTWARQKLLSALVTLDNLVIWAHYFCPPERGGWIAKRSICEVEGPHSRLRYHQPGKAFPPGTPTSHRLRRYGVLSTAAEASSATLLTALSSPARLSSGKIQAHRAMTIRVPTPPNKTA